MYPCTNYFVVCSFIESFLKKAQQPEQHRKVRQFLDQMEDMIYKHVLWEVDKKGTALDIACRGQPRDMPPPARPDTFHCRRVAQRMKWRMPVKASRNC